ncbi:MAG: DoxX family protein [Deltaproteobacteria bacterium]|nr:DoxX family protein [Deltaproteobacteria bacterium]
MSSHALTATPSISSTSPSTGLHRALWAAQAFLALAMLVAGAVKVLTPLDQLAVSMPWVRDFAPLAVRAIGAAEVLGAIGLILPSALRILPRLTALAALGLAALMVGAIQTDLAVSGPAKAAVPAVFAALSLFVAWGRGRAAPIAAR